MEENQAAMSTEADVAETDAEVEIVEVPEEGIADEAVPQKKKRKPINQQKLQDNIWGWAFCLPLIVGTIWFVYIALVMALLLSFTNYSIGLRLPLVEYLFRMGEFPARNTLTGEIDSLYWYKYLFTHELTMINVEHTANEMGIYLFNTVFYMIGIPIGMILSMFFAVCMSRDIKGGNVFRVLYYLPCVASTIAIVYTFKIMFKEAGVINQMFNLKQADGSMFKWMELGGTSPMTWKSLTGNENATGVFLTEPFWCQGFFTKLVIVIMSVWKGLGGTIILYVAGLSGVNAATKEAAQIDGANGWQIFWKVTMPDLYPTIFYNIVTSVIGGMQIYAEPVLLIGENYFTSGYVSLIWNYGLSQNARAAQGAAYGMFLAVIIFVMTLFQFWLDGRKEK